MPKPDTNERNFLAVRGKIVAHGGLEECEPKIRQEFKERVPDGIAENVYTMTLVPSTQALDSYGTRMPAEAIKGYYLDALDGVPLMNSHRTGGWFSDIELPLGMTFAAEVFGNPVDEVPLLLRDEIPEPGNVDLMDQGLSLRTLDYMLHNHFPNGPNNLGTEDVIRSIEGRTLRSVSIGFGSRLPKRMWYECGLCGEDMFDWDSGCEHFPLVADRETGLIAFAWPRDVEMAEHSLVWAGATPGAIVEKAERFIRSGSLRSADVDMLEDVWGVKLNPRKVFRVKKEEVSNMDEQELEIEEGIVEEEVEEIVAEEVVTEEIEVAEEEAEEEIEAEAIIEEVAEPEAEVVNTDLVANLLSDLNERFDGLTSIVASLARSVEEVRSRDEGRNTDALIDRAVVARTRSGIAFDEASYRSLLANASVETIEAEIEAHEMVVAGQFTPGRATKKVGRTQVSKMQESERNGHRSPQMYVTRKP